MGFTTVRCSGLMMRWRESAGILLCLMRMPADAGWLDGGAAGGGCGVLPKCPVRGLEAVGGRFLLMAASRASQGLSGRCAALLWRISQAVWRESGPDRYWQLPVL